MTTSAAWLTAAVRSGALVPHRSRGRLAGDRGEGVISAAIAVLIVAFLGAAMWVAFNGMFKNVSEKTNTQVEQIGK